VPIQHWLLTLPIPRGYRRDAVASRTTDPWMK
jgi:hypothetical protein